MGRLVSQCFCIGFITATGAIVRCCRVRSCILVAKGIRLKEAMMSTYGYGTYGNYATSYASDYSGAAGAVILIFMIAVVVLTVIMYRKYCGKNSNPNTKAAKFFRFDKLLIDKVLKVLYIFNALSIAAVCLFLPIAALISGTSAVKFFSTLIGAVLAFVVWQVIARLVYEGIMLFVRLVIDVRDIRNTVCVDKPTAPEVIAKDDDPIAPAPAPAPAAPVAAPAVAAAPAEAADATAPIEPAAEAAPTPAAPATAETAAPESAADSNTWTCKKCGTVCTEGVFCANCGESRI